MKKNIIKVSGAGIFLLFLAASCSKNDSVNSSLFSGKDISSEAEITASAETKTPSISIGKSGNWKLYSGKTNASVNFDNNILSGKSSGTFEITGQKNFQIYCLDLDGSRTVLGVRQLPVSGQRNFRDLGGYKTTDGRVVKWGTVFRSGKCNELTDSDLLYLASASLKTVVDFRSESEKASEPDKVPSTVVNRKDLPIDAGNLGGYDITDIFVKGDVEAAKQLLVEGNKAFILDFQSEYRRFFEILQSGDNTPLMFHCTAGKDRAGLAAVLFLSSLGVDKETAIQDYLLTNACTNATLENMQAAYGQGNLATCMYYVYSVQREYIQAAFDTIESNYGSVENFLTNQLNVDLNKMKSLYLY